MTALLLIVALSSDLIAPDGRVARPAIPPGWIVLNLDTGRQLRCMVTVADPDLMVCHMVDME